MTDTSKTNRVGVKFNDVEMKFIAAQSTKKGISLAEYLRDLVRQDMTCQDKSIDRVVSEKILKSSLGAFKVLEKIGENFDNIDQNYINSTLDAAGDYAKKLTTAKA